MAQVPPRFEKGHVKVGLDRGDKKPVRIYYEKTGEGPIKLFLITGLGTPASGWEPVVQDTQMLHTSSTRK
ncbi:hypothetical protein BGX29_003404 [Mortierella sp. GBA35]|nr:hypothetical protein BGX29_003404 [Mortierella sp. GBA35]